MAALALTIAAGCESKKEAVMASGIDLGNLDTTVVRGADFFQYACGGWMKKTSVDRRVFTLRFIRYAGREQS